MANKNTNKSKKKNVPQPKKKTKAPARANVSAIGQLLRGMGSVGGGILGGFAGNSSAGATLGQSTGAALSKWIGAGEYSLNKNSIVENFSRNGQIPSMHKEGQSILVRHKEYIGDVSASGSAPTPFQNLFTLPLNPGIDTSFPWLAGIAQQYQEYTWKGLVYHFVSTSGSAITGTSAALGTVMMGTQYRSTATAFQNKQVMLNEYFSSDDKPSESFCHPIECDPKENPFNVQYVRSAAVPTGEDAKTYDLGTFYLCTEGMPGTETVGELWVTYEIELRKPISTALLDTAGQLLHIENAANIAAGTPLGLPGTMVTRFSSMPVVPTYTSTTITFPAGLVGQFLLICNWSNCTAFTPPTITFAPSVLGLQPFIGGTNVSNAAANYTVGTSAAHKMITFIVNDNTLPLVITFGGAGVYTGAASLDIIVTQIALTAF